jgi:xanthine/uracil permease
VILYFVAVYTFGRMFKDSSGILIAILIPYVLSFLIQPYQAKKILNKTAKGILME